MSDVKGEAFIPRLPLAVHLSSAVAEPGALISLEQELWGSQGLFKMQIPVQSSKPSLSDGCSQLIRGADRRHERASHA